jgi:hypothetical protein
MEAGAPLEVVELLISCSKPQQQSRIFATYLVMCVKAISFIFVYNYPLSLLQKLLGAASYDKSDLPKQILQALRKGFMRHYKAGFEWQFSTEHNWTICIRSEVMGYYGENRQQLVQSDAALNEKGKKNTPFTLHARHGGRC